MDYLDLLYDICKFCLIPLLGILTGYAISWLKAHRDEVLNRIDSETGDRYAAEIFDTITTCVTATTQTYVDSLKTQNAFDAEAQKIAFEKTYTAVLALLTDEVKEYITMIHGDIQAYLTAKIEAEVKAQK